MTVIDLGETTLEPVALEREERALLGGRGVTGVPGSLTERVSLGRPLCHALDVAAVDAESRPFLEERKGSAFWLLGLTCSFLAVDDEPIEKAWLQVTLETVTPEGAEEPTAWSMEPQRLTSPVQVARSAKLDLSLKLASELVPIDVGPGAGREKTETFTKDLPFVEAHREGTAKPSWIFNRTKAADVRGVHRLRAVVEVPTGSVGRASVGVGATLKLKKLGVIPYRQDLKDLPASQTVTFGTS